MRTIRGFARLDLTNVWRDDILKYLFLAPPSFLLLVRLVLPTATTYARERHTVDILPYVPLVVSVLFLMQIPMLCGMLVGWIMLDERDEGILRLLLVTPLSLSRYAQYRFVTAAAPAFILAWALIAGSGVVPAHRLPAVAAIAAVAALQAPIMALAIAAWASNKVEGLALAKGLSVLVVAPAAAYFLPPSWQPVAGVLPSFWPVHAFWQMLDGGVYWPSLLAGTGVSAALGVAVGRRFLHRLRRA